MEATIALQYHDIKTAMAIANAISPDNFKTPPGLAVRTIRINNTVLTEIKADVRLATFIATIDDLLFSASTAEKALKTVKTK